MASSEYQFSIAQCDVPPERRSVLEAFRAKRSEWVIWLDDDEHHAIWSTLSSLIWNDVSFRTLAQVALDNEQSSLRNSLVAEHVINGHVATQILGIRRLMDTGRGNISLRRLLTEMRSNFALFTRENFVCFDGLPYDYEAIMMAEFAAHGAGFRWLETTGPRAHGVSSMKHEQFDRLSGIQADKRNREDRLPIGLLNTVEGWLNECVANELNEWSHAFLAHAGSVQRREMVARAVVTNDKITEAIISLARVAEALSGEIYFPVDV